MKKRAIVLGAGMVGSAMAADLASDPELEVTVADVHAAALAALAAKHPVRTVTADLSDPAGVQAVIRDHDIVLGALSSTLGLATLRAVVSAGKSYCDISFMPEDGRQLDALAREHGATAVIDCGVAPGVSNLIAGYAASVLEPCHRLEIMVGGLPVVRTWPWDYKAGFSPHDVLEEYTRPARLVERGQLVVKEALSEPELIDFPGVGTLEAFNTDGLRSLADALKVPDMRERTLRYPGHIALMRVLRDTGLFSKQPLEVKGAVVRPLDVTAALLFPKWKFQPGEADLTVMRVEAFGVQRGEPVRMTWELLDRYDAATDTRSMSRATAFPATIMARLIASGRLSRPGVHAPETVGAVPGLLEHMLSELARRGIHYTARVERLAG